MSAQRFVIKRELCVGNGQCVVEAPDVFDQDEDGTVVVIGKASPDRDDVRAAVTECPSGALSLEPVEGSREQSA